MPVLAWSLADVLGGDAHPAVSVRLGDHRLEQPAVGRGARHLPDRKTSTGAGVRSRTKKVDAMRAAGRIVDRHATFERATIGERTTSILAQTRSKGRMKGGSRKHPEYVTSANCRERPVRRRGCADLERFYDCLMPTLSRIVAEHYQETETFRAGQP